MPSLSTKYLRAQRKLQIRLISRNWKAICHPRSIFPLCQESEAVLIYNSDEETSGFQRAGIYSLSATAYGTFLRTGEATKMPRTSCSSRRFSQEDHETRHCLNGLPEWWSTILDKSFYCSGIKIIAKVSYALLVYVSRHVHTCGMQTCSCPWVHVCEGQRLTTGILHSFPPLTPDPISLGRLADQWVPGISLPLPFQVPGYEPVSPQLAVYTGAWDLSSSCHAYPVGILVKELPPQPLTKTINMPP